MSTRPSCALHARRPEYPPEPNADLRRADFKHFQLMQRGSARLLASINCARGAS